MYFGDSDGNAPFVNGVIEFNVIRDTLGYNLQVKHQLPRPHDVPGIPEDAGPTTIRYNVFSKARYASADGRARPNVLVGHAPLAGPGREDEVRIYGNFFHENPHEALFQGEGNLAIYDNLFVRTRDSGFPAVAIQPHNCIPRRVWIFHNTVLARGAGIRVSGPSSGHERDVVANAIFADRPIRGGDPRLNVVVPYGRAGQYLQRPFAPLGRMDLYPRPGALKLKEGLDANLGSLPDSDRDYNGYRRQGPYAGAYAGEGINPGRLPSLAPRSEEAGLHTVVGSE